MQLDVRLDGFDLSIGHLASENSAVRFTYAAQYLEKPNALPISLAMPLVSEPFNDFATRAYFDNLLQERDTARADIIAKYRLANDDIVGILYHLGKDCAGAVSVLPEGSPPVKIPGDLEHDYAAYTDQQLAEIVQALHRRQPLPRDMQDPSPLAGIQSKIAVAVLPNGRLAEPKAGAPTTHILKVPQEHHEREAAREHAAMALSFEVGLPTARTQLLTIADVPALLIERFDRRIDIERFDRRIDDGRVTRIHQEDFCQALGLPARHKYQRLERGEDGYSVTAVRGILDRTVDPIGERQKFLRATLFDILIGNVDGHAKNFALFQLSGNRMMTTPRYDVMPTMLDRRTTDEFAYRLGRATALEELDGDALDAFLTELGFTSPAGRKRILEGALGATIDALNSHITSIGRENKNFGDLIGTNIRTLCRNLGREVPSPAAGCDAFVR